MQEYKIFKYDTQIPEFNEIDFIVHKSFSEKKLNSLIIEAEESFRNSNEYFCSSKFLEPLDEMLNPFKFKSDSILIDTFFSIEVYQQFVIKNELVKNNFYSDKEDLLMDCLLILKEIKKESFGEYIKKFIEFDSEEFLSQVNTVVYKRKFCEYFKKILTFDDVNILFIDKCVKDYFYKKKYDKFCHNHQHNNHASNNNLEKKRLNESLITMNNFKSILELKDIKNEKEKIYIAFKRKNKYEEIKPTKEMWLIIENEIIKKTEEVFKIYNAFFDIRIYNFLLTRNSPKMKKKYEKIKMDFNDYNKKVDIIIKFLKKRIKDFNNGKYHNYDSDLCKKIHNKFYKEISSSTKLDFLIMEIFAFVGIVKINITDENTFLPYNKMKKYENVADYAADRQNDLDRLKNSWYNY